MSDVDDRLRALRRAPMIGSQEWPDYREDGRELLYDLLPHREPMLLVDEVLGWDREREFIVGRRHIGVEHIGLDGHFPGDPVLPGTLLLEMLGQVGVALFALLLEEEMGDEEFEVRATKIMGAHFLREVRPGDDIHLLIRAVDYDTFLGECEAQAIVDDTVVAAMIGQVMVM